MNRFIKNIISLCMCMAMIFINLTSSYAAVPFYAENEMNMLFFGGKASSFSSFASQEKTFAYAISEYLGREYNINQANVLNFSEPLEGLKKGYDSLLRYEKALKVALAFLTFSGSETQDDLAYAEAIIRNLYSKNDKVVVNFIVLPNGDNSADISKIKALASHYGIYIHNLCEKKAVLNKFGKFEFAEHFAGEDSPNEKGHDVIARIIIDDLKTVNWYSPIKNNDVIIYENTMDTVVVSSWLMSISTS